MDVRNLRGKFDEIKEEFASIKAGDHEELEIFLEIRLIYFTN